MRARKPADRRCAQCNGPLPDLIEALSVVHGADGEILLTCDAQCLAELVAALAGRPAEAQHPVAGRRN